MYEEKIIPGVLIFCTGVAPYGRSKK